MSDQLKPVRARFESFIREKKNIRMVKGLQRAVKGFLYKKHNSKQRSGSKFAR